MIDLRADAVAVLSAWTGPTPDEEKLRLGFLDHLAAHEDAMWRSCAPGHLTATTAVVSHDGAQTLLTLHPKAGMWLPMGGHCEPADGSVAEAALREATEESGISGLRLVGGLLQIDKHQVWCHPPHSWHLDLEFGAIAPPGALAVISEESDDLAWFPVSDLPDLTDDATRSLVARTVGLLKDGWEASA